MAFSNPFNENSDPKKRDIDFGGRIKFREVCITTTNEEKIRNALFRNTTLLSIKFMGSILTDEVVDEMCRFIDKNQTARLIWFAHSKFTDEGLSKFFSSIQENNTLQDLKFDASMLTDAVFEEMCRYTKTNNTVRSLWFSRSQFTDEGLSKLFRILHENKTLQDLKFDASMLTDAVFADMCRFTKTNNTVRYLWFTYSKFTDEGVSKLFRALQQNNTIQDLMFDNGVLTDAVFDEMCRYTKTNNTVRLLWFTHYKFEDEGLANLFRALQENNTLRDLIAEVGVTGDTFKALCDFIYKTPNLETISYSSAGEKEYIKANTCGEVKPLYYCMKTVWGIKKLRLLSKEELLELNPIQAKEGGLEDNPTHSATQTIETMGNPPTYSATQTTESMRRPPTHSATQTICKTLTNIAIQTIESMRKLPTHSATQTTESMRRPPTHSATQTTESMRRPPTHSATQTTESMRRPPTHSATQTTESMRKPLTHSATQTTESMRRPPTHSATQTTESMRRPPTHSATQTICKTLTNIAIQTIESMGKAPTHSFTQTDETMGKSPTHTATHSIETMEKTTTNKATKNNGFIGTTSTHRASQTIGIIWKKPTYKANQRFASIGHTSTYPPQAYDTKGVATTHRMTKSYKTRTQRFHGDKPSQIASSSIKTIVEKSTDQTTKSSTEETTTDDDKGDSQKPFNQGNWRSLEKRSSKRTGVYASAPDLHIADSGYETTYKTSFKPSRKRTISAATLIPELIKSDATFCFRKGLFSDEKVTKLCDVFTRHESLVSLHVDEPLTEKHAPALINFIKGRKTLLEIKSITRSGLVCLEVMKSENSEATYFYARKVRGHVKFLQAGEYLREELMEWLLKESISSALDMKDNKLILFVPREKQFKLQRELDLLLTSRREVFQNMYRMVVIKKDIVVTDNHGPVSYSSGSKIYYHKSDRTLCEATCGAFVVDEKGRMYILSSFHANDPKDCYLQEPSQKNWLKWRRKGCKCVHHIFQQDPLLDATLIGIEKDLKERIDLRLQSPSPNSALCGMYIGHTEELNVQKGDDPAHSRYPIVLKHGSTSKETKGILSMHDFHHPPRRITGGLVIIPANSEESFSEPGDSGSLIFRESTHDHGELGKDYSLHEGVGMLCAGIQGMYPEIDCTLAFRLDDAVKFFEKKIGKTLIIWPFDH